MSPGPRPQTGSGAATKSAGGGGGGRTSGARAAAAGGGRGARTAFFRRRSPPGRRDPPGRGVEPGAGREGGRGRPGKPAGPPSASSPRDGTVIAPGRLPDSPPCSESQVFPSHWPWKSSCPQSWRSLWGQTYPVGRAACLLAAKELLRSGFSCETPVLITHGHLLSPACTPP